MSAQFTVYQVLEKAIWKEVESQLLYINLKRMVKSPESKDAFHELAQQEVGHQSFLEQYLLGELKEGVLGYEHVIDFKIAEGLSQPSLSPNMKLKDVFLLAADREKLSHEFYLRLARIHPPGEAKKLLENLAKQELTHKQRVETLYTQVAFPQTDGG